jgi:proteasome lid subunit RPN8/RPN11
MGLLLGQTTPEGDAHIWGSLVIPRIDKRRDRVEIPSEKLAAAIPAAEEVTARTKVHTRVLGWYHSHPHITPYPSHVDLRTQATYQSLDPMWVGLIFSVFDNTTGKGRHGGRVSLHCFQAHPDHGTHIKVPLHVVPEHALLARPMPTLEALERPATVVLDETAQAVAAAASAAAAAAAASGRASSGGDANMTTSSSWTSCGCGAASATGGTATESGAMDNDGDSTPEVFEFDAALFDHMARQRAGLQAFSVCQLLVAGAAATALDQAVVAEMEVARGERMLQAVRSHVEALQATVLE